MYQYNLVLPWLIIEFGLMLTELYKDNYTCEYNSQPSLLHAVIMWHIQRVW